MKKKFSIEQVAEKAKDLVEHILKEIVDHPDEVKIEPVVMSYRVLLEMHSHPADVVHVVGKRGSVIESLRYILHVFGGKNKVKVSVDYITEHENAENMSREEKRDHLHRRRD